MSCRQPKKRKHNTESDPDAASESDASSSTVTRSTEYWIDDGNVVLQAENMQYRVHRSLLARQSTVFADMFSLPQPPELGEGESLVDGCPLVHLQDSAEDIGNLLDLLFETLKLHTIEGRISISVIGTMLRLGKKYDFETLWQRGVSLLEHDYPITLAKWDAKPKALVAFKSGLVFDVIALAHENDLKHILPSAYLTMFTKYKLGSIRKGFAARSTFLTSEDLVSCLAAREQLYNSVTDSVIDWLSDEEFQRKSKCVSSAKCEAGLAREARAVLANDVDQNLAYVATKWAKSKLALGLCSKCISYAQDGYEDGREFIWRDLGDHFGLGNEKLGSDDKF